MNLIHLIIDFDDLSQKPGFLEKPGFFKPAKLFWRTTS